MFARLFAALPAFALAYPAQAAVPLFVSQAISEQEGVVAHVASVETRCHTFSIDEDANRSATYRTLVSVEEVLMWPDWEDAEPLVAGESIELEWRTWTPGVQEEPESDGCGAAVELGLSSGDERWLVLLPGDGAVFFADTQYFEDVGDRVDGDGLLPACGEDEQDALLEALTGAHLDDEDAPSDAADPDDAVAAGCTVAPLSGVGPTAALLGMLGLLRRRRG